MKFILAAVAAFFVLAVSASAAPTPEYRVSLDSLYQVECCGFPSYWSANFHEERVNNGPANLDLYLHRVCSDGIATEHYSGDAGQPTKHNPALLISKSVWYGSGSASCEAYITLDGVIVSNVLGYAIP